MPVSIRNQHEFKKFLSMQLFGTIFHGGQRDGYNFGAHSLLAFRISQVMVIPRQSLKKNVGIPGANMFLLTRKK